jgi:RimJ/RimL family protein N-acetyltransferase
MSLDASLEGKVQWVVLADGQCAGWITLDVTSREHNTGAVGYTVGEAWRGRGIATEAVRQVVGLAFDQRGIALDRLEAVVAAENFASRRVLEKAGFTEEGTARGLLVIGGERVDHVRYGRLRGDRQDMPAGDGRVSYATGDGRRCSPRRRPPHHPHDADRVP